MKWLAFAALTVVAGSSLAEPVRFADGIEKSNPLVWSCDGDVVRAVGSGRAWCEIGDFLSRGKITVKLKAVESRRNDGWKIAGVGVRNGSADFWHLALVQAPVSAGGWRGFELAECRDGVWISQDRDKLRRTRCVQKGDWEYGKTYTITLEFSATGIGGTIRNDTDEVIYSTAFEFGEKPAVRTGRFALTVCSALTAEFGATGELESAEAISSAVAGVKKFPPYAGKVFVPGKTGKATGFFRIERSGDEWWVYDPLGRATFLTGIDHVTYGGHTCEKLGWKKLHEEVNKVKFPIKSDWETNTLARLEEWGFNMLGAGCDAKLMRRGLIHTHILGLGDALCGEGVDPDLWICQNVKHTPCASFPNVFSPRFEQWCDWVARRSCAPNRDDPWLFGYFIDNELSWWGRGDGATGLFEAVAKLPETHSARVELMRFIKAKGYGEIRDVPREVKHEFLRLAAERYFKISSAAIRRHDPNHLVLGARFAGVTGADDVVWEESGKYCDVVTFNCYPWADLDRNEMKMSRLGTTTMMESFKQRYALTKKPLMITEWSFPSLDSGLPCLHGAGQRFKTQRERVAATELMAKTMLSMPFLIGYDYFMWVDQPPLGISVAFPEDSNYGLINLQGEAYPEITAMFARLHHNLGEYLKAPCPKPRAARRDERQYASGLYPRFAKNSDKIKFALEDGRYSVTTPGGIVADGGIGGRSLLRSIRLKGNELGSYSGMVRWANVWCGVREVADAQFRREHGCVILRVTGRGWNDGIKFQVTHDLTFSADKPFILCEVVEVKNIGELPLELKEVYICENPPFATDGVSSEVSRVPSLWNGVFRDAWIAKDGRWIGGITRAANARNIYYFLTGGKDAHPDAVFQPIPSPMTLAPGAAWNPQGGAWMIAVAGLDGVAGWNRIQSKQQ